MGSVFSFFAFRGLRKGALCGSRLWKEKTGSQQQTAVWSLWTTLSSWKALPFVRVSPRLFPVHRFEIFTSFERSPPESSRSVAAFFAHLFEAEEDHWSSQTAGGPRSLHSSSVGAAFQDLALIEARCLPSVWPRQVYHANYHLVLSLSLSLFFSLSHSFFIIVITIMNIK